MPTPNALPEALTRRFADDVARLTGGGAAERFGIAVSGGPDSVAMLLLASAAFPNHVEAATVDHRLRPEAVNEAQFVARLCTSIGVPHIVLTLDALPDGNVSAAAREARYAALEVWCDDLKLDWLITAHHADDQLETMMMRLNRGSGVAGLSGIRARQGRVIRPLLHWRQAELAAIVTDAGIVAVDDPTNRDNRYDRARLRRKLADIDWIDARSAALSADALVDADGAIEWAVDGAVRSYIFTENGSVSLDRHGIDAPPEIIRRLVLRCLRMIDPDADPRGAALSRFIEFLENGRTATLGAVVGQARKNWRFTPAPPRRNTG